MSLTIKKKGVLAKVVTEEKVKGQKVAGVEKKELVHELVAEGQASVSVELGTTINLGNYNNLKISVTLHKPCGPNELDASFAQVLEMTEAKLNGIVESYGLNIGGKPDGE